MNSPTHGIRLGTNVVGTNNGATGIVPLTDLVVGTPNHGPMKLIVDPVAQDWYDRVIANGGTAGANAILAVSKFVSDLRVNGLFSKIVRMNAFCGDGILSALVPVIKNSGGALDINVNFVGADYSESTSFVGNGTTKYIDSTYIPSGAVGGIFCHLMTNQTSSAIPMGCRDLLSTDIYRFFNSGTSTFVKWGDAAGDLKIGQLMMVGRHHAYRENGTSLKYFINGTLMGVKTTLAIPLGIAPSMFLYAQNAGGSPNVFCISGTKIGGYAIDDGTMSESDALKYSNSWNDLMTALGRNV